MKNVIILGSSGSIGTQTLDIIRKYPKIFNVTGLALGSNTQVLDSQINEFNPDFVCVANAPYKSDKCTVLSSPTEVVKNAKADIIVLAMVGLVGLIPAYEAVSRGCTVALANKETLVSAGEIIIKRAIECGANIIPVDSEHSAIWQCLMYGKEKKFKKIILTASGGAFRGKTKKELQNVTVADAIKHPIWNMGTKVTIDSSTLMNKGLEVIEAMHLFNAKVEQIETILHKESIIHSMVEYNDNSIIAQMSKPNMKLAIELALTYPDERLYCGVGSLDFASIGKLHFEKPDYDTFPCLKIAYDCARCGMVACSIMNSANEASVGLYAKSEIGFYDIPALINSALDRFNGEKAESIESILELDIRVSQFVQNYAKRCVC